MKINAAQITSDGLTIREEISASQLEIETEVVKFSGPVRLVAEVSRITNAVTIDLGIEGVIKFICARCLEEFTVPFKKKLRFVSEIDNKDPVIDLEPQIREEIIIDYPIKPLCKEDCKGLCPKCGKNLNEGKCNCS